MGNKYDMALSEINELYQDRSFTIEEAVENLEKLQEEIEIMLDGLKADLAAG